MVLWIFENLGDLVDVSPILLGGHSLARGDDRLETLDTQEGEGESTDDRSDCLLLVGLLEEVEASVEHLSILGSLVDANEELGEVEVSNLGTLEDTLSELGNVVLGHLWSLDLLGGDLEHLTKSKTELGELTSLVGGNSSLHLLLEGLFVGEDIIDKLTKVVSSVRGDGKRLIKTLGVERWGDDVLASWESLLDIADTTLDTQEGSEEVTKSVLVVLALILTESLLESFHGEVESEEGLILRVDAHDEVEHIEVTAIGLDDTLEDLGDLGLVLLLGNESLRLLTEEVLGEGWLLVEVVGGDSSKKSGDGKFVHL